MYDTGVVFIRLRRAALCCEETCEALFELGGREGVLDAPCPGCGGTTWVPLTCFVAPIGLAEEPVASLVKGSEGTSATP